MSYTLSIIPARGGSRRLPEKNIITLAGKPLIAHSIEQAMRSKFVNKVVVSTDDQEIANVALKYGAEVIMRPADLASATATSESALLHALNHWENANYISVDLIVFLQCTSPLRNENDIDNAILKLTHEKADSLFSACRFKKYIWEYNNSAPVPLNYDYTKRWREQDFPIQFQENGSIYVFKPWVLRDLNNRLGGCITIYEMDYWNSFQIDDEEDFQLCEYILSKRLNNKLSGDT